MPYAIELNPRQTARTLEQAIRHGSIVTLEPRIWPEDEPIECRLLRSDPVEDPRLRGKTLVVEPCSKDDAHGDGQNGEVGGSGRIEGDPERFGQLVGTYCDATVYLGDHFYLFSADVRVVEQLESTEGQARVQRIYLSRPSVIQVAQRRRFRRLQVAKSTQVELRLKGEGGNQNCGIAWLCNVSGDGLACRTEGRVAEQLYIGEEMTVTFGLSPSESERFVLDTVLCNKTPAGTEGKMILGLQFLTDADHQGSATVAESLHKRLVREYALAAGNREEADA